MMAGLVARGKWDAWTTQKGLTKDDAAGKYVKIVKELLGIQNEAPKKKEKKIKKQKQAPKQQDEPMMISQPPS